MSIPGSVNPLFLSAAGPALQVSRSLRFNSGDSSYLSKNFSVSGNRKIWTWCAWVKRSALGANQDLFNATTNGSDTYFIRFASSDVLQALAYNGSTALFSVYTSAVFRDVSAWYHIAVTLDTTQSTDSNRLKLYVNGIQITAFGGASYPALNTDYLWNSAVSHEIGRGYGPGEYLPGYLAEVFFIDGQALTPSSFTEVSATTGQIIPKAFSGSYGTNGFYLKFADNSTTAALGTDSSGNGNTWTTNNFSVTAGAGNDSLVDTPTSYGTDTGVGGEVRGNYATLNPLAGTGTLANGNLDATGSIYRTSTIGLTSGKWYCEITAGSIVVNSYVGIFPNPNVFSTGYVVYGSAGGISTVGGTNNISSFSMTEGNIFGMAFDRDASTLAIYKNGTLLGQFSGMSLGSDPWYLGILLNASATNAWTANFGQRAFAYPVSGYKALVDTNIPVVVAKPNTLMDVIAYSGSGASRTFTDLTYSPDLVWIKQRSGANNHRLYDVVRGATKALYSNLTDSEGTDSSGLTAFTSNGFTLGDGDAVWNASGQTYAAWCWDAGTTTASNPDGSITSQVRANPTAGFSVATFDTASFGGASATVGHGLGVAPSFYIVKPRDMAGIDWYSYHISLGNTQRISLNSTAAAVTSSYWNNTSPTSTVFSLSNAWSTIGRCVVYAFAPVVGYSNGFSYTGNGSADGSFVYLGFRPRLIMLKRSDSTSNWTLLDTSREGYNVDNDPLYPNLADAEGTTDLLDITSNGFKLRSTDASVNASAGTYIGFAWAEAPFAYSRAR